MNKEQIIHVAMTNSYNILTDKCTIDDVLKSGLLYFAHHPEEGASADELLIMVAYFESKEAYQECQDLMTLYNQNFNADGSFKEDAMDVLYDEDTCKCENPLIKKYSEETTCLICNKRIQ
jgi:hypothetical protein